MLGRARLRPHEIERLTVAELALYLDDDMERPPREPGEVDLKAMPGGREDYIQRWRMQSLTDRAQRARQRFEEV